MTPNLHDLLHQMYVLKETPNKQALWDATNKYIANLERSLFKRHFDLARKDIREAARSERILALHDFIRDYALPRGKSIAWVLSSFRIRFVDVETTLTLRRSGVSVGGAETGFRDSRTVFVRQHSASRRACVECSWKQLENVYFKNRKFKGERARQHYRKQVAHNVYVWNITHPIQLEQKHEHLIKEAV